MSNPTTGHSPSRLEEKLAAYWRLVDEREALEARIARAKDEKDSVNERVFRRVVSDYEDALGEVSQRLDPIEQELEELRREVGGEVKALEAVIEKLEDEQAEAGFRHRLGEYTDDALAEAEARLEPQVAEARRQRDELQSRLAAMDRRRPAADAPAAAEDIVDLDASSRVDEVRDGSDEDPLAALSDPDPSAERVPGRVPVTPPPSAAQAATAAQPSPSHPGVTTAPSYPSMKIRSGVHEGKIVPLLPMTMTIGREHDNNIELKDENVARYHARVTYEEGRFYIEDLDTSSGTWVNGVRQRRTTLSPGDVIRIGETELAVDFA